MEIGSHFDKTVSYTCTDCSVDDIFCNGQSVLRSGRITLQPAAKTININYPSFEDEHACVYVGVFKINNESYKKNIFILENSSPVVKITKLDTVPSPGDSQPFKKEIPYKCTGECSIDKVTVDGVDIPHTPTRRSGNGAYYDFTDTKITIIIPNFSFLYRGAYQCIWNTAVGRVTKLIMVISEPGEAGGDAGGGDAGGAGGGDATTAASDGEAAKSGSEAGSEGESTTAASGAEGGGSEAGDAASEAPAEGGETSAPAESEAPPS